MPTTSECPFCGRELRRRTATLMGRTVFCGVEECGCEGAVAERERERAEREAAEAREELRRAMARYGRAGIPKLFLMNRPEASETYSWVRPRARQIAESARAGRGAYLVGPVGTYKTLVAATAARYAVDAGMSVRFTSVSRVLDAVRGSYGTSRDSAAVMDAYASAGLLVLDDLGKESPTDWTLMKLFDLVNDRYEQMRPLVVTTQYARSELVSRLAKNGDEETAVAIVSRLAETCDRYDFAGPDRRISHGEGDHASQAAVAAYGGAVC